jgi:hypothetical protein
LVQNGATVEIIDPVGHARLRPFGDFVKVVRAARERTAKLRKILVFPLAIWRALPKAAKAS